MRTLIPKYQSTVRIALNIIVAASVSHPARAQGTTTTTATNQYATVQKLATAVNLFEDKSRTTYLIPTSPSVLDAADRMKVQIHEVQANILGIRSSIAEIKAKLNDNKIVTQELKAQQYQLEALASELKALKQQYEDLSYAARFALRPAQELFAVVGTAVGISSRFKPVYSSSLLVTSNSLGVDIAYVHYYGDTNTIGGIPFRPNGDSIAVRVDLTHGTIRGADSDVRRDKQILLQPFILPDSPRARRFRKSNSYTPQASPQYEILSQPITIQSLSAFDQQVKLDLYVQALSNALRTLENKLAPLTNPMPQNDLDKDIDEFAHKYLQSAGQLRVALLGGYASFNDIGSVKQGGIALSNLRRMGSPASEYRIGSALYIAANLQVVWFDPYARARSVGGKSQSDVSIVASVAWQDRFPHFVKYPYMKPDGTTEDRWYFKKWTQQYGLEYSRANDVDGGDYYGAYARLRTNRVEWHGAVGTQARIGTSIRFGVNYFIY